MSLGNINSWHRNERIITFVCVQHTTDVETHAGSISWVYFRGLEWSWCRFLKWIGSQNLKFMIHCKNLQRLCWLQMVIVVELFRSVPVLCFGWFWMFWIGSGDQLVQVRCVWCSSARAPLPFIATCPTVFLFFCDHWCRWWTGIPCYFQEFEPPNLWIASRMDLKSQTSAYLDMLGWIW